ncbi:hypothetical protein R5R35_000304 [Gryllus longicercus]|uniref:Carboxylic ester hydrolase n=1 Tax=Gryllus longicercus TaxID=2509291 RepID=A0AAN9VWQ1_9ORTH
MKLPSQSAPLLLALLLLPAAAPEDPDEGPVVKVSGGEILGRIVNQPGAQLSKYYSFEGIPYARPPLDDRRFKAPEEVESWTGVRNATAPGSRCVQKDVLFTNMTSGDEDCLFINVFTADPPESWPEVKRPVAVFVHGGAFIVGSGDLDRMRPDSILRQEVVLVSFNYRLGVLGFLNTEDKEAPGNAGLKDAVQALHWVQKNIKTFGGNPEQVTVFGESAGAAMVHYLLLTPLTKGLLHGAIAMSGDALSPWTLARRPRQNALALRQLLAACCPDDAPDAIARCLRRVDAKTLVGSQSQAPPEELLHRLWRNPFLPSVEAPGASDAPFLTADPEKLLREGHFLKVPFITGFTNAEGILYIRFAGLFSDPAQWASVDERFVEKFRWEMPLGIQGADDINAVRAFYMGDRAIRDANEDPEALRRFLQLTTDMLFATSSVSSARLMAQAGAPVWVYEFTHENPSSLIKHFVYNASHVPGVAHGEDLGYLFNVASRRGDLPTRDPPAEDAVRQRLVRLFMDFAKTGNPTPMNGDQPTLQWPPYTADKETYMEMGTEFTIKEHVLGDRIALWRRLSSKSEATGSE